MRDYFEEIEDQHLAPYAVKSRYSKGRKYAEEESYNRTRFHRDRDRIIHAKAFRRLKYKTQVFIEGSGDYFRSRLTHSLEVAQISRHLARLLRVNEDLAESIALAHDLGHTPFGHSGEDALNLLMKNDGGFEHNFQSKRIVEKLENRYPSFPGLNLNFEITEGLIKHATPWDNPKESKGSPSLEAQIVNVADEIAYNNHDLDDGLYANYLSEEKLNSELSLWRQANEAIQEKFSHLDTPKRVNRIISQLISWQIQDVFETTRSRLKENNIKSVSEIYQMEKPLVSFSLEMKKKSQKLRKYLFKNLYAHPTILEMNLNGKKVIRQLFEIYNSNPSHLPAHTLSEFLKKEKKSRVIADYIAGMTDNFAKEELLRIKNKH